MIEGLFAGKYEIIEPPRIGGMSIVVKGRERDSGAIRALKYTRDDVEQTLKGSGLDITVFGD